MQMTRYIRAVENVLHVLWVYRAFAAEFWAFYEVDCWQRFNAFTRFRPREDFFSENTSTVEVVVHILIALNYNINNSCCIISLLLISLYFSFTPLRWRLTDFIGLFFSWFIRTKWKSSDMKCQRLMMNTCDRNKSYYECKTKDIHNAKSPIIISLVFVSLHIALKFSFVHLNKFAWHSGDCKRK